MTTPSLITLHAFADPQAQATALADRIANDLRGAIAARGQALIAVSGGSTPKLLFEQLATRVLGWNRVTVTLVDERCVPASDPRSNARLVQTHLLQNHAQAARFVPLFSGDASPELGLAAVEAAIAALPLPFDVVALGMGEDGHTASFFPDGDRLTDALDPAGSAHVLPIRAPDAGEPRITLTLPLLVRARTRYLLAIGAAKRAMLDDLIQDHARTLTWPIRAVLSASPAPVATYWSP